MHDVAFEVSAEVSGHDDVRVERDQEIGLLAGLGCEHRELVGEPVPRLDLRDDSNFDAEFAQGPFGLGRNAVDEVGAPASVARFVAEELERCEEVGDLVGVGRAVVDDRCNGDPPHVIAASPSRPGDHH